MGKSGQVRIHRWTLRKKYLHSKAVYRYERFCVPVLKRFQDIVKPFAGREVKIKIELQEDGFTMQVHLSSEEGQTNKQSHFHPLKGGINQLKEMIN